MSLLRRTAIIVTAAPLLFAAATVSGAAAGTSVTDRAVAGSSSPELAARVAAQLRLAPGGVKISPNEISWDRGRVVMSFPLDGQSVAPASTRAALELQQGTLSPSARVGPENVYDIHGCPEQIIGPDYYCFYEHSNWGGRRIQFKDSSQTIYFADYGFQDMTSSWVNGGGLTIGVDNFNGTSFYQMWQMNPHSLSSYVGSANNDRADRFRA